MKKQVVHVLIVTDDDTAAQCLVRLMHMSWDRDSSAHKKRGLIANWTVPENALDEFDLPGTSASTPYSEAATLGALRVGGATEYKGRIGLFVDGRSPAIRIFRGDNRVDFDVRIRMVVAHHFADHRVHATGIADLLTKREPGDPEPTDFVVLGVTDASLRRQVNPKIGSGVDQILTPGLLAKLLAALPSEPRVGLAITGLERDFVRFDASDPQWRRYGSAREAAWDPHLIKRMLYRVLADRPHLQTLMQNDEGLRTQRRHPIAVTAVMPCGFLRDFGVVNYNAHDAGWLQGSPAVRGERDGPYFEPYCCADPLLTALTGIRTEFQVTSQELRRMFPVPGRRRAAAVIGRR